jgi:hypothetical protein
MVLGKILSPLFLFNAHKIWILPVYSLRCRKKLEIIPNVVVTEGWNQFQAVVQESTSSSCSSSRQAQSSLRSR